MENTPQYLNYEDMHAELVEMQKKVEALDGLTYSFNSVIRSLLEQIARMKLAVQHSIDTWDDLK